MSFLRYKGFWKYQKKRIKKNLLILTFSSAIKVSLYWLLSSRANIRLTWQTKDKEGESSIQKSIKNRAYFLSTWKKTTKNSLLFVYYTYLYANQFNRIVRKLSLYLLLALLLSGCCRRAWKVYRELPTPDEAYITGSTHGYTVYIWNCYNNKRVVVYQFSAEMSCKYPEKEEVACGEQAEIEKEVEGQKKKPITDLKNWQD